MMAGPSAGTFSSPSNRQLNQSRKGGTNASSAARYHGSTTRLLRGGDATALLRGRWHGPAFRYAAGVLASGHARRGRARQVALALEDAAVPRPDGARARRAHTRDARGRPGRGALRARLGDLGGLARRGGARDRGRPGRPTDPRGQASAREREPAGGGEGEGGRRERARGAAGPLSTRHRRHAPRSPPNARSGRPRALGGRVGNQLAPATPAAGHPGQVRARLVPTARGARRGARPPGFDRRAPRAVVRRRSPRRYPHAARRRPARADPGGLPPDGSRRAPARVAREGSMPQGTIKDFEGEERIGSLLMDDRTEVAIDAVSVEGSGLRSLRIGQRVRFDLVDEAGRKVARNLQIVTL